MPTRQYLSILEKILEAQKKLLFTIEVPAQEFSLLSEKEKSHISANATIIVANTVKIIWGNGYERLQAFS